MYACYLPWYDLRGWLCIRNQWSIYLRPEFYSDQRTLKSTFLFYTHVHNVCRCSSLQSCWNRLDTDSGWRNHLHSPRANSGPCSSHTSLGTELCEITQYSPNCGIYPTCSCTSQREWLCAIINNSRSCGPYPWYISLGTQLCESTTTPSCGLYPTDT